MNNQTERARDLDARILALISTWQRGENCAEAEIDALFIEVARHQLEYNAGYRAYAQSLGSAALTPRGWTDIAPVPTSAFKSSAFTSFPLEAARQFFHTSGTTAKTRGRHYFDSLALYEAASGAIFARDILRRYFPDPSSTHGHKDIRLLNVTPSRAEFPHSSLGYMAATFARRFDSTGGVEILKGDTLDLTLLARAIMHAKRDAVPVVLLGTALAFAQITKNPPSPDYALPADAYIIETGGFKGQNVTVTRSALYEELAAFFAVPQTRIGAEFGMTELSSQYYDAPVQTAAELRIKTGPPWLRARIVNAQGNAAAPGEVGTLQHFDLANRGSAVAIETEDLAVAHGAGFVLIGRDRHAELRGCSLDAEHLRALVHDE